MSLASIRAAADVERNDDFHLARLMLLMLSAAGRSNKSVDGITKLAKMDFLLRYPSCLARVLADLRPSDTSLIPERERQTIEAQMVRYRYGPWDGRYRRWIGLLVAKGLAETYLEGRTVHVRLTEAGTGIARDLADHEEFKSLAERSVLVARAVGGYSSSKLMKYIYDHFPEVVGLRLGAQINL